MKNYLQQQMRTHIKADLFCSVHVFVAVSNAKHDGHTI